MSKRMELLAGAIALGLMLNAAVGFYRILEPESATAQGAVSDVNLLQVGGKPLDVYTWSDGTASPRMILDSGAHAGSKEFPIYVRIAGEP